MPRKKFIVMVDDNYHPMDESERYKLGEFKTLDSAIAACQRVVNNSLINAYTAGMSEADLLASYALFGADPFIIGADQGVPFSARDYAKQRCHEICSGESASQPLPNTKHRRISVAQIIATIVLLAIAIYALTRFIG